MKSRNVHPLEEESIELSCVIIGTPSSTDVNSTKSENDDGNCITDRDKPSKRREGWIGV